MLYNQINMYIFFTIFFVISSVQLIIIFLLAAAQTNILLICIYICIYNEYGVKMPHYFN